MTGGFVERFEAQVRAPAPATAPQRLLVGAVAVIALASPLVAATQPWRPLLGDDRRGHPTTSAANPPRRVLDTLAVLRRPQRAVDRGSRAQHALRYFGAETQQVMTRYVRVLRTTGAAAGATLVPIGDYRPPESGSAQTVQRLCVFVPDRSSGGAQACVAPLGLDRQLPDELGRVVFGLVPDGVARVRVHMHNGTTLEAPVQQNFYAAEAGQRGTGGPVSLTWLDRSGTVKRTIAAHAVPDR